MQRLRAALRFFGLVTICFRVAVAATTHTVLVGNEGSFYNPATISAELDDVVVFEFAGLVHTVIQGSFENPCFPLEGGFSSGAVPGPNVTFPQRQTWDLKITNVNFAIWFYCGLIVPQSHCASGMVGAINPPSISSYSQYLAAAKSVTNPPSSMITPALTGQFASATALPGFPTTSVPPPTSSVSLVSISTSTSTPTPTSTPSLLPPTSIPTSEEPPKNSKSGGIIGGSVAAGVVLLAILIFIVWVLRRRRDSSQRGSKEFFRYRAHTRTLSSRPDNLTPFTTTNTNTYQELPTPMTQSTPTSASSMLPPSAHPYSTATPRVSDSNLNSPPPTRTRLPRRPPLPPVPNTSSPMVERKLSLPVVTNGTVGDSEDIRALAREVAAVLSQGQRNVGRDSSCRYSAQRQESPAPPQYQ